MWKKRRAQKLVHGGSTRYSENYLEDYWPCAGGLSEVSAIGDHLRDPINSGPTRYRLAVYMDAVAENGRNPVSKYQIQPYYSIIVRRISGLTRDGTAESVS